MNRHLRLCKLSKNTQARLVEYFALEVMARSAADLLGIQPNSAALYYRKLRELIAYHLGAQAEELFGGEIEVDERYFGGKRKGKRGRGAAGKVAVFGILKRGGRVYTKIIPNASSKTLMPIIANKITPDSIVYTDRWRGYNALDVSEFKHFRINHSELFADGRNHIKGIENF